MIALKDFEKFKEIIGVDHLDPLSWAIVLNIL